MIPEPGKIYEVIAVNSEASALIKIISVLEVITPAPGHSASYSVSYDCLCAYAKEDLLQGHFYLMEFHSICKISGKLEKWNPIILTEVPVNNLPLYINRDLHYSPKFENLLKGG